MSLSMPRAHPAEPKERDRGVSLIEMMVALLIFALFSAVVVQISTSFLSTENTTNQRFNNVGAAQVVMDRLTAELRAAVLCQCGSTPASAIASADGDDITFYASLGGATGPTEVQFSLSGTTLTEIDTPANAGGAAPDWTFTGPSTSKLVSSNVVNSTSNPLFTFYNDTGAAVTGSLTTASATSVVQTIGINLVVQDGVAASATTLADTVQLLNVSFAASS